jgi:hypothetical protein
MKMNLRHKQSGSSLVVVIITLATLMVIVGVAAEYTTNINRNVQRSNTLETAIAVGDSCIDLLFAGWRTTCRQRPTNARPTSDFASITLPTSANFPTLQSLPSFSFGASTTDYYGNNTANPPTVSNFKIVSASAEWSPLPGAAATPEPMFGQIPQDVNSLNPNTNPAILTTSLTLNYVASADITLPTLKGNVVAKVRRVFQKEQLSPWNFAIFYVDPLEIHPGPLFTVTGWVHTNSDLYTAHNTLTFADKVTYGSDWFVNFMPGDGQHPGETPQSPNYASNLPPARDQALQLFGMDSTSIFSTSDANPNNDSYHELIDPPIAGYSDPLAGQRYWDQAGVVIQISDNPNPNQPGFDGVKGHDTLTMGIPDPNTGALTYITGSSNGNTGKMYNSFVNALTPNQSIQDNREQATIGLTTLDVGKLFSAPGNSGGMQSFNGIIYITDTSAASNGIGKKRGIRITNGAVLPSTGLTVASNNPVYIQGDFNTGGTGSAVPSNNPSNLNADGTYVNPANPPLPDTEIANNYKRAPTSILADAVTILSNSWSDSNSNLSLSARNASPTTVNTAIISGTVPTAAVGGDGSYSGGAENFPRFLENWANDTLTYYGSMVELYKSQQSTGEWGKANVYSPPTREWLFDTNFKTKPPPGSIMVYSYIKGKWSVL